MKKKELVIKVENLSNEVNNLSERINKLVKSDRLEEVINLLLDHLNLKVKNEDYIGEETNWKTGFMGGLFPTGTRKVVKTRQVLEEKKDEALCGNAFFESILSGVSTPTTSKKRGHKKTKKTNNK